MYLWCCFILFCFSRGLRSDWLLTQRTTYLCLTIWRLNIFDPFPSLTFFFFNWYFIIFLAHYFLLYITLEINLTHTLFYNSLKWIYNFGKIIHYVCLSCFMDLTFHYWIRTIIAYHRSMLFYLVEHISYFFWGWLYYSCTLISPHVFQSNFIRVLER